MRHTSDVILIGGGVTGLSTAVHLKLQGVERVTILERHHIGAGQSHRAAGVLRGLVRDESLSRALVESMDFFKTFDQRFAVPLPLHPAGYLLLSEPTQAAIVDEAMTVAEQAGCQSQRIDARQAQQLQPGLREDDETLYVYEPGAIHLDPMPTVQALLAVARQMGVTICEGCEVTKLVVQGDRFVGVDTLQGRYDAPQALVATSVWGTNQLAQLGVDVPVYPHRAEMAFFHIPWASDFRVSRILTDARSMLYLRPEGQMQMFVGWRESDRLHSVKDMVAENPDHYRQTAHFESLADMHRRLAITLPPMAHGFVHRTYACVYDYTPDGVPILDRVADVEGLYFALGFSGGGFSLSPWVGRCMAQFMVEQKVPADIERYDLKRFAEGRLFTWANVEPSEDNG
jgi:sarcosine oxidase subunit beta